MKKALFLSAIFLVMVSCKTGIFSEKNNKEVPPIGGQTDKHGCLTAAGESWSQLRGTCLQIFNHGQRLNPIATKEGDAVISAFALFNDDKSKVEIFLPTKKSTVILDKSKENIYKNNKFEYNSASQVLKINGKEAFKADKKAEQVLILFYDSKIGIEPLMKAMEAYNAKLVYDYGELKGVAISVSEEKTEEAMAYFKKVKGVLSVQKDKINQLH